MCRPYRNQQKEIRGYHPRLVRVRVVGTGLTLPLDVEPYGPGDSEYNAARTLLHRTVGNTGCRFADYVVAEGNSLVLPSCMTPVIWNSTSSPGGIRICVSCSRRPRNRTALPPALPPSGYPPPAYRYRPVPALATQPGKAARPRYRLPLNTSLRRASGLPVFSPPPRNPTPCGGVGEPRKNGGENRRGLTVPPPPVLPCPPSPTPAVPSADIPRPLPS